MRSESDAEIAAQAASLAGELLLRLRQAAVTGEATSASLDADALRATGDRDANHAITKLLTNERPEDSLLSEEAADDPRRLIADRVWIIDPLDGTTNFVHGLPIYSVSIALKHKEDLVVGVVYEVGMDECFSAYSGGGARLNGQSIQVTETNTLKDSLLATGFPYYDFEHLDGFQNTLATFYTSTRGLRRIGTAAVDLAYTACGRFDGYFEYGLSPWDVAAGIVLVREAGGIISDFSGGPEAIASKSIVATNKRLYPSVFNVVRKNMGNA